MGGKSTLADEVETFLTRFPEALYLGLAPLFAEPKVVPGSSTDWILVPSASDPQVKIGTLNAPRRARQALRRLEQSKAPVTALYIAHEVPAGASKRLEKSSLEHELQTDPGERNKRLAARLDKVGRTMTKTLAAPLVGAGAVAGGLAVGLLAGGLDPAVLAAVTASQTAAVGERAAWFHIVSWV